ncbi:MAG: trehalose-phosphatase [Actinomycetia bacterium]|nr:trehalose-phosphatase [Actinomycetes bacterium]
MPQLEAVIFDTDGVITQTAAVHFSAWKSVFDGFLAEHATGDAAEPFTDADYRHHVDGIGRYDGVDAFLRSRGFELPRGNPEDPPGDSTVCAVGNTKNSAFEAAVHEHGVLPYLTTRRFIESLHEAGIRTAVISASKNCEMVLHAAGMDDLFEARVDGLVQAEMGFPGKPAPDVFLEAASRLGVKPGAAGVVEDAISGVRAGREGDFGLVIGLDRTRNADPLGQYADIVVPDCADLEVVAVGDAYGVRRAIPARAVLADLPVATEDHDITRQVAGRTVAVFLDYDGTLTPIVDRPEDATIDPATRAALEALAEKTVVGVVSGRDLPDVLDMVGEAPIWFSGSHGFDVRSPDGSRQEFEHGAAALPALDAAERELADPIGAVEGAWVERKRFAIAVHYRATPDELVADVESAVAAAADAHPEIRMTGGKRIFELRPAIEWDKGKAVRWLVEAAGLDPADALAIFIGDDVTDEDGFAEVRSRGVGIVVGTEDRTTAAHDRLDDPDAVRVFLEQLTAELAEP